MVVKPKRDNKRIPKNVQLIQKKTRKERKRNMEPVGRKVQNKIVE